jgi:hypothetical protein
MVMSWDRQRINGYNRAIRAAWQAGHFDDLHHIVNFHKWEERACELLGIDLAELGAANVLIRLSSGAMPLPYIHAVGTAKRVE